MYYIYVFVCFIFFTPLLNSCILMCTKISIIWDMYKYKNVGYKEKLEAELAAELERERLMKEARLEEQRKLLEEKQKAERAERLRRIKAEQNRVEMQVKISAMKKSGMTNAEIAQKLESERLAKEKELERERKAKEEEETRRLMAEAEDLKKRLAKGKPRRKTAGDVLDSAKKSPEKDATNKNTSPEQPRRSKLLAAVNQASKKKISQRRITMESIPSSKPQVDGVPAPGLDAGEC